MTAHWCAICGHPIDTTREHITVVRQLETADAGTVTVHSAEVLAQLHTTCLPPPADQPEPR